MTRPIRRCAIPFILALFTLLFAGLTRAAIPAKADDNLTGVWAADLAMPDGNIVRSYLELQQNGDRIAGAFWYDLQRRPILRGTIANGELHLEFQLWDDDPPPLGICNGIIEGDKLRLKVDLVDDAHLAGVAERTNRQALAPPARLPLPELHEVSDNGLARTPPMGWNSWNRFKNKVSDAMIRAMADAMVASGMKDAGYTYINIDDTWEGGRDATGTIRGNRKFPNMKALAEFVHARGLKIGLYSSPGPNTCDGYLGSYGHEAQDARTYAAWGFDYLKYDWCSAERIYSDSEMRSVYQKMGDALLATGRPIVFSLCQYGKAEAWKWAPKAGGNLWRTTGDINDTWQRMTEIGFSQFDIAPYARSGHWNDPDMLEVGNGGMTADEYRTHMSLWALLAAPLIAGNDLRAMDETTKSILMNREVIAIDQDPAAKPVKKISDRNGLVVVERELHDGSSAIGLFNRTESPVKMSVVRSDLGLHGPFRVRDLWAHKEISEVSNQFTAEVPRHGVVLVRTQ